MPAFFIISWLVIAIPNPVILGNISNHQIDVVSYAYQKAVDNGIDPQKFICLIQCESGLNIKAFNPETLAKKKGITKYSSCGLFQHNDKRCNDKNSELYDAFYNIDFAIEKYKKEGFNPWQNCWNKIK